MTFQIYKLQVIIQTIKFQIIKLSTKERAIEEKVRLADLQAEATFIQKKRYAELQAESLRIEKEMAKAHQQDQQSSITENQNEVTDRITEPCEKDSEIGNMLYQLVKEQSAPSIDIEVFDGNSLHYTYFRSMFQEAVEKRIKDPQGKLTRLINLTCGEAKELVKPFIHDRPECGFANAMRLLEKQYGNPHKLLASYRKEIKQMAGIKPGDAAAYRRLFNFLIKCQSLQYGSQNPLDTPNVICMILATILGYLQDRWNRNDQKIRKVQMREPGLIDLKNFIEDEMVLVNDPLFSREAVGQYEEKSLKSKADQQSISSRLMS